MRIRKNRKGFGWIEFDKRSSAVKCLMKYIDHRPTVGGKKVSVKPSLPDWSKRIEKLKATENFDTTGGRMMRGGRGGRGFGP